MVHVTYWVPAGRAMDATAGTLRFGATDATEVGSRTPEVRRLGAGDAGRHGFSHRETACSSPQGRTHRVGYTTQKTKARVEEKAKGTPNVPSGRRKSPAKAVLVQANIRQVPAHVRWCQRSRGTNRSRNDFRRDIDPDGIINLITFKGTEMMPLTMPFVCTYICRFPSLTCRAAAGNFKTSLQIMFAPARSVSPAAARWRRVTVSPTKHNLNIIRCM